jgi:MarR family transcriptional regulator for hemolysin
MKRAETEQLGPLIAETARAWRGLLDQRLHPLGLSHARWLVLVHLQRGGDGLIQRDLAARVGIEGATLVGLLDRMADDGWIVRRGSDHDRRSKRVHLTAKAHEALKEIKAVAAQLRRHLIADLPADQVETCMRVLARIKERADDSNGGRGGGA